MFSRKKRLLAQQQEALAASIETKQMAERGLNDVKAQAQEVEFAQAQAQEANSILKARLKRNRFVESIMETAFTPTGYTQQ